MKQRIPLITAVGIGALTLIGLLFSIPAISRLTLTWGALFAAFALLLGILNLFNVHIRRLLDDRNLYSGLLVITMMVVFLIAITDQLGLTSGLVDDIFIYIQMPLEAAIASLLFFFLLFALVHLLKRNRSFHAYLFLGVVLLAIVGSLASQLTFVPQNIATIIGRIIEGLNAVVVTAGVRGLLIGIALGTIMLSIRLLLGLERPYNK